MTVGVDPPRAAGLTTEQARRRHTLDGANELPTTRPVGWWPSIRAQLTDAVVLVLVAAAVLTPRPLHTAPVDLHDVLIVVPAALAASLVALFARRR